MLKLWKKKFNYTVYKPKIKHIVFRSFLFNYLKNYKKAFLKTKNTVNIKKKIFLTFIKNPTYYIEYVRNDKTAK